MFKGVCLRLGVHFGVFHTKRDPLILWYAWELVSIFVSVLPQEAQPSQSTIRELEVRESFGQGGREQSGALILRHLWEFLRSGST